MLVNLYRDKTPIAVLSLPVFIAICAATVFLIDFQPKTNLLDWHNSFEQFIYSESWLNYLATVLISSITAHQINNVYNRHTFYSKASFLPGLFYIIILFSMQQLSFSMDLIGQLFIVLALGEILKIRRQAPAKTNVFWASFLLGIAFVFSSFSVLLILLPWISLAVFRPFVWREWAMVILGGMLPLIYYLTTLFVITGSFYFNPVVGENASDFEWNLFNASNIGYFGLLFLGTMYKYSVVFRSQINRFKKQSQVILFLWILTVIIWSVAYYVFDLAYMSFAIPSAIIMATPILHSSRTSLSNVLVIIWLIISLSNMFN
ncbi:hypothetical protein K6119_09175 [Paracrocinitomix mangrovi]|uniref:hypothetical protein n=1 Tax=Paracrocinitomix mangrovi TaxID=2862509 RepID=UPI001C8EF649|nr:hypothetical protein [Paracrocinitomix mangrovi]UKN03683.1 hypothetical protein K6119_09175 [Paracrocinitomix mangrovi]